MMRQQQQMMVHVSIDECGVCGGQALQMELAIVMDPSRMPDTIVQEIACRRRL